MEYDAQDLGDQSSITFSFTTGQPEGLLILATSVDSRVSFEDVMCKATRAER